MEVPREGRICGAFRSWVVAIFLWHLRNQLFIVKTLTRILPPLSLDDPDLVSPKMNENGEPGDHIFITDPGFHD